MVQLKAFPRLGTLFQGTGRTRLSCLAAALLLAGVSGCGKNEGDYFPLDPGYSWTYRQVLQTRNKGNAGAFEKNTFVVVETNLRSEALGNELAVPRLFNDGGTLYFAKATDGVAMVARRAEDQDQPVPIAPRTILKHPLAAGDSWTEPGETQILRRTILGSFGQFTKSISADGPLAYKVESLDDSVRVKAGTFHHCLRLHGTGNAKLDWADSGVLAIAIDTVEWYAPGVGLVKRIRKEDTGADGPLGADMTEELESITRPGWLG